MPSDFDGRILRALALLSALLLGGASAQIAAAQQVRVFVASSTHTGDLGGLAGANAICEARALDAGLVGGPWVAWLSTASMDAVDGLTPGSGPFVRATETSVVIADDVADLTDGSLDIAILRDENGVALPGNAPWTGTDASGSARAETCLDWTSSSSGEYGWVGLETSATSTWTELFIAGCNQLRRFYCFEAPGQVAALSYYALNPLVVSVSQPVPVTLLAHVTEIPSLVQLDPPTGPPIPLTPLGGGFYSITISAAAVLDGYVPGNRHNHVGQLEVFQGGAELFSQAVFVNIRHDGMAPTGVWQLDADAQMSPHVLNLREDVLWTTGGVPPKILNRFYEEFEDGADFVAVVSQVRTVRNRYYAGVRNGTSGLGLPLYDNGDMWGSKNRLLGIVHFPIDSFFDLGDSTASHEIGHRWMAFLDNPEFTVPHWPISDVAYGVMGFNIPGTGVGGTFSWDLIEQPSGDYLVQAAPVADEFNDLELYLMGLVDTSSVADHIVFQDQDQADQLFHGGILAGPVDVVTIADVVSVNGPRVPAAADAQTDFRLATIVLSDGGLLSQTEMEFFEHMAARGEAITALAFDSGFASGIAKPFHPATQGLGTLTTLLPCLKGTDPDGDGLCPPSSVPALPGWALALLATIFLLTGYGFGRSEQKANS